MGKFEYYFWCLILCVNLTKPWDGLRVSVSVSLFLVEINIKINRLGKAHAPPWCEQTSSNQLNAGIEQKKLTHP